VGRRKSPSEQGVTEWGGENSNLRPTDYEFDPAGLDDQRKSAKTEPDQRF